MLAAPTARSSPCGAQDDLHNSFLQCTWNLLLQGAHPAWHCKELLAFKIEGLQESGHAQRFPCSRWLGRPECGGQDLRCELLPATAGEEEYEVGVYPWASWSSCCSRQAVMAQHSRWQCSPERHSCPGQPSVQLSVCVPSSTSACWDMAPKMPIAAPSLFTEAAEKASTLNLAQLHCR